MYWCSSNSFGMVNLKTGAVFQSLLLFIENGENMYPYIDFFTIKIPSYGLCMVLAFLTVGGLSWLAGKKKGKSFEDIVIIMCFGIGAAVFAGYLMYLLVTYSFFEIAALIRAGEFSFITNPGLVFYGGLLGCIPSVLWSVRFTDYTVSDISEIIVPYVPLGHALGRIGCFLAGCCHGTEYDGLFSVRYSNSLLGLDENVGYFPVQLVEALANILISAILLACAKGFKKKTDVTVLYLMLYSAIRFCLEFLRGDVIRGSAGLLSTSQWISVALLFVCVVYFVVKQIKNNTVSG